MNAPDLATESVDVALSIIEQRDSALLRIADLTKRLNAAIHERDALREMLGATVKAARTEPALTVYCDNPDCHTPPLTMQVAPPEDAIPQWVRGMGWSVDGEHYFCGGHGHASR